MIRSLVAALVLLLAPAASAVLPREIPVTKTGTDPNASYFLFDARWRAGDFTAAVNACARTTISFEQANTAQVTAYAVYPTDDTLAEIQARPVLGTFIATQSEITIEAPSQVRVVLDVGEVSPPASWVRIWCSRSAAAGGGGGATDLAATPAASTVTISSSTGVDAVVPAATTGAAGVMTAADKTKLDNWVTYACANYAGADIGARCNAAYADALADGVGAVILDAPGRFIQTTKFDACDEAGNGDWIPVRLEGTGTSSGAANDGSKWTAGAGLATTNVNKNGGTYTVTQDVLVGRDQIDCSACDFLAAGIRRGDLIETTNFASSSNNYNRANSAGGETRRLPMKVYSVTATRLILEGEINPGPNMVSAGASATGDVRKLSAQIEMCHHQQYVQDLELDGAAPNADIGIHRRMDNIPSDGCTGAGAPYPLCSGAGTGTVGPQTCVGCGETKITTANHQYLGVAVTAPATGGQNDHYFVEKSRLTHAPVTFWMDDEQAEPGPTLRDTQLEAFGRNGFRAAAGNIFIQNATIVSREADCIADSYGMCRPGELLGESTTGMAVDNSSIEVWDGRGVGVGTQIAAPRQISLTNNSFLANTVGAESFFDGTAFCGTFHNQGNNYFTFASAAGGANVNVDTTAPASCPLTVTGESNYYSYSSAYPVPKLILGKDVLIKEQSRPAVDTRTVLSPFHLSGEGKKSHWFAVDGAKSLCTNLFNSPAGGASVQTTGVPDEWCDSGGSVRAGKTTVEVSSEELVTLTQTQAFGEYDTLVAGGDTDPVGHFQDVFVLGGCQDQGDECGTAFRGFVTDSRYAARASITGTLAAGGGIATLTITNATEEESKSFGENRLLVFDNNASAGAVAQNVELTSVPAGTIDHGVAAAGTWGPGAKNWGLGAGIVASSGVGPGWCISPADTISADPNGVATRIWFQITASGGDVVTTSWYGQGTNYGVALGTLAEVGANEARIAPCVLIDYPILDVGQDRVVDRLVVYRDPSFDGTTANTDFYISEYPSFTLIGASVIVGRQHGTGIPHMGVQAFNYVDGIWGRYQGKSAFWPRLAGSTSGLVDGNNHAWEHGLQCDAGICETGFGYSFVDAAIDQQAAMLNFGDVRYALGDTFNIMRIIDSYEDSLAFDPNNGGWGSGIATFKPFTRKVASGARALATASIGAEACSSADINITASGALSSDQLTFTPSADVSLVTGYAPAATGGLYIVHWITTNLVHFKVCNPTNTPITPGAVTLNWSVMR